MQELIRRDRIIESVKFSTFTKGGNIPDPTLYIYENIIYPETTSRYLKKCFVPILYRITIDGILFDTAIQSDFELPHNGVLDSLYDVSPQNELRLDCNDLYKLTKLSTYESEAVRVFESIGYGLPLINDEAYLNLEFQYLFHFEYHEEYFKTQNTNFILNPDERPKFIGDKHLYDIYIRNLNGCDGIVDCLAIVEIDGKISNIEFLHAYGKTNFSHGMNILNLLKPWKPAMKDGNAVRSQLRLKLYT